MSKIIIADDHPLYRSALIGALPVQFRYTQDLQLERPVESSDLASTIDALIDNPDADMLLLDLHMPGTFGLLGLLQLRKQFPSIPVVVISATEDLEIVRRVIAFGASAFIPKSASHCELEKALQAVMRGDLWVPEQMWFAVMESDESLVEDAFAHKIAGLTGQQYKVLYYLTEGWLNKQIAHDMGITEATVKAHLTAIFRKLGCTNRTQVVILAQKLRLDPPEDMI